ncbi:myosin-2 isoform X1 [Drosophila simulans]|uniref:GD24110 n=1 Tax=Drosophila simulans TaxID=7240 RepID=B4Q7Y1_DROSI|nr:myosin-2 isoform X1 [Drosophila simulans]EDX05314.1 GD24110 [Drosophila simulans]KMY90709.1 uncharacterized protein Dsimw501_GD24110, isoform A [Drosophila simulans]
MDRQGVHNGYGSTDEQRMVLSTPQQCTQRKSVTSMKLFTMVVLHSWRQRRKEVRELKEMVQHLQDSSMKTKNELHVCGTLVRVEEKRNRELQIKLKLSTMSIDEARSSCESLTNSIRDLTTEKKRLETDLEQRSKELNELEEVSDKTKRLLFDAYMDLSYLQKQLAEEQRTTRRLQGEKNQLIQEVILAESRDNKYRQVREWYQHMLHEKDQCISSLGRRLAMVEEELLGKNGQTRELQQLRESAQQMSNEISELRQEINRNRNGVFGDSCSRLGLGRLQDHVFAPFQGNHIWMKLRRYSFNAIYLFALYLLPGMPLKYRPN